MRIDSKRTIAMIAGVALTACLGLAACSAENTGPLAKLLLTVPTRPVWAATAAPRKAVQRAPNRMAIPILTTQFMAATCHAMYVMLGVMR